MVKYYKDYFKNVISKKKILDKNQLQKDKIDSTKFSFFDYLYFGENNLSDIFRDILDIEGNHGQGALFFDLFLQRVFKEDSRISHKISCFKDCKPVIKREVYTDRIPNAKRRIDLVIEWNNDFAIGIENKPFDRDQENQLVDYAEHLKAKYKDFYIVYLAENEVTEKSILKNKLEELKSNNKFKHINYSEDIDNWLGNCVKECQSPKIVFFLEDVKNKLKNHFIGMEVDTQDEIVKYTMSEDTNIKAIFDIYNSYNKVLSAVAKKFTNELQLKFSKDIFEIKDDTKNGVVNIQFRKINWPQNIWCCISTEFNDSIFLGIWDEHKILSNELLKEQITKSNTILENNTENSWAWWSFPVKEYNNWQENADKIILMNNSKSLEYYFKELLIMIEIVDQNLLVKK